MTLIAINCGEPLNQESRYRLEQRVGSFREICYPDETFYWKCWDVLKEARKNPNGHLREMVAQGVERLIDDLPITDEELRSSEVLVLLASTWVTAGIEIIQIETIGAFERRKAGSIRWMVYGNDILGHHEIHQSREEDIRALSS